MYQVQSHELGPEAHWRVKKQFCHCWQEDGTKVPTESCKLPCSQCEKCEKSQCNKCMQSPPFVSSLNAGADLRCNWYQLDR